MGKTLSSSFLFYWNTSASSTRALPSIYILVGLLVCASLQSFWCEYTQSNKYFGQTGNSSVVTSTHWIDCLSFSFVFFRTVSCRSWESWTTATSSACGTSSTPVETRSVTSQCCYFEFICFITFVMFAYYNWKIWAVVVKYCILYAMVSTHNHAKKPFCTVFLLQIYIVTHVIDWCFKKAQHLWLQQR